MRVFEIFEHIVRDNHVKIAAKNYQYLHLYIHKQQTSLLTSNLLD